MPTLNNNINPTPETPRPFEPLKQQSELQVNSYIYEDLKNKAQISLLPSEQYEKETSSLNSIYNIGKDNRVQTKVADIGIENYQRLSSGEFTPLYKNIIVGTNNEDRLARQQTTGEKWANGWAKFGTGTLNTIAGATVGAVYGIGSWISEGNFQAMYDNDFTNYLDDLNTKMRYKLPNYYTEQERNTSFDVTSANFWADKVLGAAAFTVGAIVSEGIWAAATGGASLTTTAARWAGRIGKAGKWSKAILGEKAVKAASGSYKSWLKAPLFNTYKKTGMLNKDAAIRAAKTAEVLNTTRFLATSSGYEAGVEALHYKKEAEENFYRNFYELNGRQPNGQEIADFTEDLENSANVVFGGNMALLSVSNAVMFGSLFNIKNPFRQTTKGINRKLFGIGIEETVKDGKKVFQAITPTKGQKLFTSAYGITKPLATEGLFEEGGQGALSGAAGYWTESGYNPKYNGHSVSMMDAMAHGMAEQYGTKEGWEEIGIGFIIGGGASIIQGKGKPLDIKEIQEARKNQENIVKGLNTFGQDVLVKRMIMNNKIQGAVDKELKATKQGNYVEAEIANQDKLLTEIEFMHGIGEDVDQLPEKYRIAMSNMTEDQFKEAGIENPQEYIETVINAYSNVVKRYKKNIRYAEAMYGVDVQKDNHDLAIQAQALAYTITTGETASTIMEETLDEIGSEIGSENQRVLTLESELQRLTKNQRSTLSRNVTKLKAQKEKQAKLVQKIQEVQNAPKETEGDRQSGAELAKLNKALLETNNEISTLESEVNRFKEELSQERTRRQGMETNSEFENLSQLEIISLDDLLNIDEKLNNINDLINSYEGHNPQLYSKLTALAERYNQAKESFVRYNAMGVALSSGKVNVRPKKVGGALGKLFDKKKYTQDEFTQAFLDDTVGAHLKARARATNEDVEVDEIVPLNEVGNIITEERKNTISEKLRNNQPLSKRERQLYEANQEAIEKRIEKINKEKGDNPLQKQKENLINKQIQELEQERKEKIREVENKKEGTVNAKDLKKGDKITHNGREYTVESLNKDIDGSIGTVDTVEGVTITNPYYIKGRVGTKDWVLKQTSPKTSKEAKKAEIERRRQEELKSTGATSSTLSDGSKWRKVEIKENGKIIPFNNFTVKLNESIKLASVMDVNKDFGKNDKFKGYGWKAYIALGKELTRLGYSFVSSKNLSEGAIKTWDKLVEEGYAYKRGDRSYKFQNKENSSNKYNEYFDTLKEAAFYQLNSMFNNIPYDSIEDYKSVIEVEKDNAKMAKSLERYLSVYPSEKFNIIKEYGYRNIIDDIANNDLSFEKSNKNDNLNLEVELIEDKRFDAINAKYDAELATLEGTTISDNKADIERINKEYNNKIQNLKKQLSSQTTTTQSEVDQLRERLESTMKEDYYPLQYVGEDYDEMVKNKPSEEDINRYRELVNKDRLAEEEFEFEELQQKLSNWRVLDSAVSGTQSLADIINLIQQLETQVEQNETVTEITEEFDTQIIDDNLGSGTMVVYELTQNTTGNATAKILKNNRIKLSHIKIDTILERLGGTNEKKTSKGTTVYNITPENTEGSIEITVTPNGAIEMNLDDFLSLQQSLNLYVVDSGQINWTYKDIYEVVGDEFVEKPSDFIDDDISGNIYELQKEDEVEFYYDSEDAWNQELYKKYKKGKITKEEFRNQVKIYIRKDGKNYGTLKSMREGSVDESIASIRDNTTEVALNEQSALVGKTTVSQIMLGSPKFTLNETNQPTELEITDRGIEEVVTTGYILDNKFTLSDKTLEEKTDQSFVGKISKNQEGKKIPVVVVKKGKHFIAYPISVIKKGNSQASRFEAIINNEFSDDNGKVREINELLISLGIAPSTYNLIDLSEQEKLNRIQEDLSNYKVYTTAEDFANKYDKKLLKYDATIKIDLEDLNRSISSPKVRIDLDNITIYQTSELKYESMTELEDILSDLSLEVDRTIMNDYVDNKGDAIENKLTDVYADDSVIKKPENQLDKMHNVRMLMKGFPLMPPKFKQLLGQDKVKAIEKAIKKIEFLRKQIDTKANTEVQKKKNELKNEC